MEDEQHGQSHAGTVIAVRGSVVDARFPHHLPSLHNLLRAGDDQHIAIEMTTYLDEQTVLSIALTATQGLARGAPIVDTGSPVRLRAIYGFPTDNSRSLKRLHASARASMSRRTSGSNADAGCVRCSSSQSTTRLRCQNRLPYHIVGCHRRYIR